MALEKHVTMALDIKPKVHALESGGGGPVGDFLSTMSKPGNQQGMMAGILGGNLGGTAGAVGSIAGEALGGPLGAAIGGKIGGMIGGVLEKLAHPLQTFEQLASKIASFVQASNPMMVERLNLAYKDLTGIIGQSLEPAMETVIDVVRSIGDGLASSDLKGETREMLGHLRSAFEELKPALSLTIKFIGDLTGAIIEMGNTAARTVEKLAPKEKGGVTGAVLRAMSPGIGGAIADMLATAKLGTAKVEGASFGQSAQAASFTSIEGFGKEAAAQIFGMGVNPQVDTAANTKETAKNTAKIAAALGAIAGQPGNALGQLIGSYMGG